MNFYTQDLDWSPSSNMEVATVDVPVDYSDPDGPRFTLGISRIRATDPARRRGILLSYTGGPGGNEGLMLDMAQKFEGSPLGEVYDLIGFDSRGYSGTPQLYTEVTPRKAGFDSRPDDSTFADIANDAYEAEQGCLRGGGDLRPHISTRNIARDMDVIRGVLGEEKLSFVGYAYGSYLGAVYGTMFGAHIDRIVLDSSVHPDWLWRKQFLMQAVAIRRNVDAWAEWSGKRNKRFGLGRSAAEVIGAVEEVAAKLHASPTETMNRTSFDEAVGNGSALRPGWADLADLVAGLRSGPSAGAEEAVEGFAWQGMRVKAGLTSSTDKKRPSSAGGWAVEGKRKAVIEAVTCEGEWPADLEIYFADMRKHREHYPYGYGVMRAQPWVGTFRTFTAPEPMTSLKRDSYQPGLIVQADSDPLDPAEGAFAMAERLGYHLVLATDDGGHELYPAGGNALLNDHVNRYLVEGVMPPGRMTACPGSPRPDIKEG